MTMAERIRYLVKRHPKSRRQIANDLFISSECLGNYINGRRTPDVNMVRNMADYFQVSADYIICAVSDAEKNAVLPTVEQERNLLRLFRTMTPPQREIFLHSGYGIANYEGFYQPVAKKEDGG
ncbi:MAG: helix-turn-helix domain-containing protein [Eubacterium sp.]|nr:helix-turn-helix domain-containing protein [Eubacterium sp.]